MGLRTACAYLNIATGSGIAAAAGCVQVGSMRVFQRLRATGACAALPAMQPMCGWSPLAAPSCIPRRILVVVSGAPLGALLLPLAVTKCRCRPSARGSGAANWGPAVQPLPLGKRQVPHIWSPPSTPQHCKWYCCRLCLSRLATCWSRVASRMPARWAVVAIRGHPATHAGMHAGQTQVQWQPVRPADWGLYAPWRPAMRCGCRILTCRAWPLPHSPAHPPAHPPTQPTAPTRSPALNIQQDTCARPQVVRQGTAWW